MSLYILNSETEHKNSDRKKTPQYQTSDFDYNTKISIYIQAIQRVIVRLESAISAMEQLEKIENFQQKVSLQDKNALIISIYKYSVEIKAFINSFLEECNLAEEGQEQNLQIQELSKYFQSLEYKISLFFLLKELKYGTDALKMSRFLLNVFEKLASSNDQNDTFFETNK